MSNSKIFSLKASNAVENIASAVTHAKFIGSADIGSDEVVLLKILQVSYFFICLATAKI